MMELYPQMTPETFKTETYRDLLMYHKVRYERKTKESKEAEAGGNSPDNLLMRDLDMSQ